LAAPLEYGRLALDFAEKVDRVSDPDQVVNSIQRVMIPFGLELFSFIAWLHAAPKVGFAVDSPVEGTGFEPSVPPDRSSGGTYLADNRSDASTLFSSGARRRLRATRIRSASLPDPATSFANSRYFLPVSPKETRIHKWDQEFESAFLQRGVYKLSVPLPSRA
jgi:hypothetical protein